MTTRRYKYDPVTQSMVEIVNAAPLDTLSPYVMPDLEQAYGKPMISPIDDSVISSRSQLREHCIRHNVTQCGELKGSIIPETNKRHNATRTVNTPDEFSWNTPTGARRSREQREPVRWI
jgi:hypothetical protein